MSEMDLIVAILPDGGLQLEWESILKTAGKTSRSFQDDLYKLSPLGEGRWLLALGFSNPKGPLSPSLSYWREVAATFTRRLIQTPDLETLRENVTCDLSSSEIADWLDRAPMMTGLDYLDANFLKRIWKQLHDAWGLEIKKYAGPVAAYVKERSPNAHLVGRIFFHLVENKTDDKPFAFLATYSTRLNQEGNSKHVPLKFALQEFSGNRKKLLDLLATVSEAAKNSSVLKGMLDSGGIFNPMAWSADQAFPFLKDIPVFENAGILCRIPNWWKGGAAPIRLDLQFGNQKSSFVGMESILSFEPRLLLDGTPLSKPDIEKLLAESEGLAFIKNKWVAVDPVKLKQTLEAYEKARQVADKGGLSWLDAMRLQLSPEKMLDGGHDSRVEVGVSHGAWLSNVIESLQAPQKLPDIRPGRAFKATLRKYQQTGLNWLGLLHRLGLGACLADDMGLGKTVQVLAFLNHLHTSERETSAPASLLVVPASLLANWADEIKRFYPDLSFFIAHPSMQPPGAFKSKTPGWIKRHRLVITTYSLAGRYDFLKNHSWHYLILDEAQAIKNPGTRQTRILKKYHARNRLILTGTPLENRLSDLWSLFDFLNPGLLGTAAEFKKYTKALSTGAAGYAALRQLIRPYILRRLKTDRAVIRDLPPKIEMKAYPDLTRKQIVLYQKMVKELEAVLKNQDGIQRKGLILSSLMKLKQLCNHPDQYLGNTGYAASESGKFERLGEICRTIHEKRERVLVFTQFKEIIDPLCRFLEAVFGRPGLSLHGGVSVKKRKTIIAEFQADAYMPFMVLSLKAGGVGLNLTRANHVIHFDRWWNPAVEDQATDRAFRIGQKKKVLVHKFITRGTIEEKIDRMIDAKKQLSEDVIAAGSEEWITEMNNEQVLDMFRLSLSEQ